MLDGTVAFTGRHLLCAYIFSYYFSEKVATHNEWLQCYTIKFPDGFDSVRIHIKGFRAVTPAWCNR